MKSIIYIGMDVHSKSYTFCALEPAFGGNDKIFGTVTVEADAKNVVKYIGGLKKKLGEDYEFVCGYEAGCLGYSLYNQLQSYNIPCVILAPSTMYANTKRVKTDTRDAKAIAQCLAYGTYKSVYIPTEEDNSIKEYVRMRDDHKLALKKIKQQILALCLRNGCHYEGKTNWTAAHLQWLKALELSALVKETLTEYLLTYVHLADKIERMDARIEEIAEQSSYQQKVRRLSCFLGIRTHTALSLIVETGDFNRFRKGNTYAAFLGLTPSESSSGEKTNRGSITKAGNSHLRKLLAESAQSFGKGKTGFKSKALKARQAGNDAQVIAYADKANERLRRKYYRLVNNGKARNVAVTAVARELA